MGRSWTVPVTLAALAAFACANRPNPAATPAPATSARSAEPVAEGLRAVSEPSAAVPASVAPAAVAPSAPVATAPREGVPPVAPARTAVATDPEQEPGQVPTTVQSQDQRRALLDMRSQLMTLTRELNQMIAALGPAAPLPRERPAMIECPWPMPEPVDSVAEPTRAAPPGVISRPRRQIPDCAPPDWVAPELTPFTPPELPTDRPRPIVEDYLSYVVTAPPAELVERFDLDTTYYKKFADANGYPILASARVSDAALAIVRDQVNYLLGHRPEIRETMIQYGARIVIMAETEYTMDIPEQRNWTVPKFLDPRLTAGERGSYFEPTGLGSRSAEAYWNNRARGMGGTLTSCAEENVLGYYGTRYWGTNICVHEFAHGIMGAGIGNADPGWFQEIVDSYHAARAACGSDSLPHLRSARGYSGNTFNEYWATGVEWYVGNGGRDRADLKAEDPTLYELISRLVPEDRHLPRRANVANRTRQELDQTVRERNPDWWQREQVRQEEQRAARGRGAGRGGRGGGAPAAPETCIPTAR